MITSILVFILVLSILILVHEFGHFMAARRMGIWVREFGIGLPREFLERRLVRPFILSTGFLLADLSECMGKIPPKK